MDEIQSDEEADLEERREKIRDSRWARRREQLGLLVGTASLFSGLAATGLVAHVAHLVAHGP